MIKVSSEGPVGGTIHVWLAELDQTIQSASLIWTTLSDFEQARAERLRNDLLRWRFVWSHGWLRVLLSQYLRRPPGELEITETPRGKPVLSNVDDPTLHFNMSHSGALAAFAFSNEREVGVDVELTRAFDDQDAITSRFYSEKEAQWIKDQAGTGDTTAFLRIWTRKEAYVKALGRGVSHGLNHFSVVAPHRSAGRFLVDDASTRGEWTIVDLDMPDRYFGAVSAVGDDWRVHIRYLEPRDFPADVGGLSW